MTKFTEKICINFKSIAIQKERKVKNMSYIKRWLEENIDNISDEELLSSGFEPEEILLMRDSFGTKKEETQA